MKHILITLGLLTALLLAACSSTFPLVQDTRTATPEATWTPWVIGPVNDTPTPEATVEVIVEPTPAPTEICLIKGTAASHIFHVPGQTTYKRTQVLVERGDRWFCTPAEAEAAGYRKAIR